jgi:hypothetical protein
MNNVVFCQNYETIQHLFFDCKLAKFIWTIIYFTFGLEFPVSINHLFGAWMLNMNSRTRKLVLVGIGAMLWSMWLSRNDIAFDKKKPILSYMQVIYMGTYWTRTWSLFQKEDECKSIQDACRLLETVTMEIFAKHG